MDQTRDTGLDVRLTETGDPESLSAEAQTTVYRILQESLTNVVKYARNASTVDIVLQCRGDLVGFSVTDDGGTVPGSGAQARTGNGLTGMRERVAMFDGALRAGPTGSGWAVTGELKLGEPR